MVGFCRGENRGSEVTVAKQDTDTGAAGLNSPVTMSILYFHLHFVMAEKLFL